MARKATKEKVVYYENTYVCHIFSLKDGLSWMISTKVHFLLCLLNVISVQHIWFNFLITSFDRPQPYIVWHPFANIMFFRMPTVLAIKIQPMIFILWMVSPHELWDWILRGTIMSCLLDTMSVNNISWCVGYGAWDLIWTQHCEFDPHRGRFQIFL